MRTTLVIPDSVFRRLKALVKKRGETMSGIVTEAIEERLVREEMAVREPQAAYSIRKFRMGRADVNINNRDELFRAMEQQE